MAPTHTKTSPRAKAARTHAKKTRTKTPPGWLKVGDHVVSKVPGLERKGVVVEDRGPIAINGSQIVAIRIGGPDSTHVYETRAEDLERVAA